MVMAIAGRIAHHLRRHAISDDVFRCVCLPGITVAPVTGSRGGRRCLINGSHVVNPTLTLRRSRSGTNPRLVKPPGIENR